VGKLVVSTLVLLDGVIGSPDAGRLSTRTHIERINEMPKYVASRTLREATWNATLLGPDIVGAIERLKAEPGKDLIKYGLSRVDDTLLREGLIDELRLWIVSVTAGSGQRLFEDTDSSSLATRPAAQHEPYEEEPA
jgi:dihydrofolate reductase